MFYFSFFIDHDEEGDQYPLLFRILEAFHQRNLQYSKIILHFMWDSSKGPNPLLLEFNESVLYTLNQVRIDLDTYDPTKSEGEMIKEDCDKYGGLLTFLFLRNMVGSHELSIDLTIQRIVESVQSALVHQYYFKGSASIQDIIQHSEDLIHQTPPCISPAIMEKSYYGQYRDHLLQPTDRYYIPQIISFHFNQVWVKKMIFELGYLSSYREIIQSPADLDFLLNILYYKYKVMYAKDM
jgi:hypothetical protein